MKWGAREVSVERGGMGVCKALGWVGVGVFEEWAGMCVFDFDLKRPSSTLQSFTANKLHYL